MQVALKLRENISPGQSVDSIGQNRVHPFSHKDKIALHRKTNSNSLFPIFSSYVDILKDCSRRELALGVE